MPNLPRILMVDDEPENLRALERTLRTRFEMVSVDSPREAYERVKREDFAVMISDQRMPEMRGTDLFAKVALIKPLTTRVILTAYTDTKEILDAINRAEIYRYITKPWDNAELLTTIVQAAEHHRLLSENRNLLGQLTQLNQNLEKIVAERTEELKRANEKLADLASTDPLTRVLNRRAFFAKFHEELERSSRYQHAVSVVMIDVDHFKTFNDMEGHVYGDEALKKIAATFNSNLRKTDVLGRYGGEEFVVLMPETRLNNAAEICNRLRMTIESMEFQGQRTSAYLTVSIGIAAFPQHGAAPPELIESADRALYEAKNAGRNRVVIKT